MAWLGRRVERRRAFRSALTIAVAIAAGCSSTQVDDGPLPVGGPPRPAPRVLGDAFCLEGPDIRGDMRTAWALGLAGSNVFTSAMVLAGDGNLAIAGVFADRLDVGWVHLKGDPDGTQRPFLLMVGSDGTAKWGKSFSPGWFPIGVRAGGGGEGVDVLAGADFGPVDFGSGPLEGTAFVVRFDATGRLDDARALADLVFNGSVLPALGPAGEIAFQDINFQLDVVDDAGTVLWQKPSPTLLQGQLAFDAAGDLIAAAAFSGFVDWVSPAINLDEFEGVLAKLDATGEVQWLKRLGTDILPTGLSIAGQKFVVTGTSGSGQEIVLTALKDDGGPAPVPAWTRRFAIDPYSGAPSVSHALPDGGAYVLGVTPAFGDLGLGPVATGGLFVARIDGAGQTNATQVFHAAFPPFPLQVVPDADGNAYVTGTFQNAIDLGAGTLRAMSSDGTGTFVAKIEKGTPPPPTSRCASAARPGIALGDPSPIVPTALALSGPMLAIATGAEVFTLPITGGEPRLVASAQAQTVGIAIDATSVYWANFGTEVGNGTLLRDGAILSAPLAGGEPKTLVDKLTGVLAMAIDDQNLYYAIGPVSQGTSVTLGKLMSIPLAGGTPKQLASGYLQLGPLAAYDGAAYLAGRTFNTGSTGITRITSDGKATVLAISDRTITALAADAERLYWLDYSELSDRAEGQLRVAPLSGGAGKILAGKLIAPQGLAIIGDDVYYTSYGKQGADLLRLPKAGGAPGMMARGFAQLGPIAGDGSRLAWVQRVDDFTWSLIVRRP